MAITPDVAGTLIEAGHSVAIEKGAGQAAGYLDVDYEERGCAVATAEETWSAELVATIDPPPSGVEPTMLLGLLKPFDDPATIQKLASRKITAFAFEAVPRITRAQAVDALSSQATAAGYQAALEAAALCDRFFPMLTTAAGTIPPAKVVVLGAGVAGLQAIATAKRLGAVAAAFDVRAAAAEQVRSLGASFIELEIEAQDASQTGGYAREVADDEQTRIINGLQPHIAKADAVVTTAAIPGRPAPLLITRQGVESMRVGSVIVDLAASTGGNCELTEAGTTVDHAGVKIVGATDLVSRVAGDASRMYAKNVATFFDLLAGEDGVLSPDWDDEIVASSCVTRDGEVIHPRVREALGLDPLGEENG